MQAGKLSSRLIKNWHWCAFLLLLLLAPLNSKLAGACWLALCLLGAWSFRLGTDEVSTLESDVALGWVFACLAALVLRAVPQFYWEDAWRERHAEFRLLLGALGVLGLVRCARFTSAQLLWLGHVLVLALWLGFGWILVFGAAQAPTNQIPWGASMSLLVCVVLALALSTSSQPRWIRLFYASGIVFGVCAVLLSQARGSYGIVFWVGGVVLWHCARGGVKWRALASHVLVGAFAIIILVQIFPQLISIPAQRIQLAVQEFSAIDNSKESSLNTSVGVRLYLWKRAVEEIPDHGVMGVGREARMAAIQRWGSEVNSTVTQNLGHLHNNYVENLFDQSLFGLGSFLSFFAGLFYMVMRLRKNQPMAALGISGILFMHASSSLTNGNFAHNYYPTMLSVAVSVCLLLFIKTAGSDNATLRH